MKRIAILIVALCWPTLSLSLEIPEFDIARQCKNLPFDRSRTWCVKEERCNQKLLAQGWTEILAGVSRDVGESCVKIARAAPAYNYWMLYSCLAPVPELGRAPCK